MYISRTTTLTKSCKPLINQKKSSLNNSKDYLQKTPPNDISFGKKTDSLLVKSAFIMLFSALLRSNDAKKTKPIIESCNYKTITNNKKKLVDFFKAIPIDNFKGKHPKANLHMHSLFSDGKASIQNIIEQAIKKNKKVIAITDHNTTEHLKEIKKFRDIAQKNDLTILNGVELTAYDDSSKLHILIYGADEKDPILNKFCHQAKNSIKLPAKETIKTLSKSYVTVLAHPIVYDKPSIYELIKELKTSGLDGVEVFYPYKKLDQMLDRDKKTPINGFFKTLAILREFTVNPEKISKGLNLIITGGKDSHSLDIDIP